MTMMTMMMMMMMIEMFVGEDFDEHEQKNKGSHRLKKKPGFYDELSLTNND